MSGLAGRIKNRNQEAQQKKAEKQWARKETAQDAEQRSTYDQANSACLAGKGYTVK